MALIRYPGSKEKLARQILLSCPDEMVHPLWSASKRWEYREPFFGAGAIGFRILETLSPAVNVWLNDIDYWLVCLWKTIAEDPETLCKLVQAFTPSPAAFYDYKRQDGELVVDVSLAGFRKLALHQMSFSGLGAMAGGPLGGGKQNNTRYRVDCRWNPDRLEAHIWELHTIFARFKSLCITCQDFAKALKDVPRNAFVYLDPPYVNKGPALYSHSMNDESHQRLARHLKHLEAKWLLSYDDADLIRELYGGWCDLRPLEATYTVHTKAKDRPKNRELLISPNVSHGRHREQP